jgi:ABC-type polysaccharide/polyol phosphate transport system ATPase subunit
LISVQNVSKHYQGAAWSSPWRRTRNAAAHWALRNINFDVDRGECFGIVGPNGSGKSTLLEIIAGILEPSEGRVLLGGKVSALLELGAGFNPEFTGVENVKLNAELHGLTRGEIEARLPDIERFAEIGEYFRRPVREYSSGMYVRLAFAAAIHQNPEILIVDEALAVGDVRFANKCIRRLEEMKANGATILFVSHDLGLVKRLCHRAALLWDGKLELLGAAKEVGDHYIRRSQPPVAAETNSPSATAVFGAISLNDSRYTIGEVIEVRATISIFQPLPGLQAGVLLRNRQGIEIAGTNTSLEQVKVGPFQEPAAVDLKISFPCRLTRGDYAITLALQSPEGEAFDWRDDCLEFQVIDTRDFAGSMHLDATFEWSTTRSLP